MMEAKFGDNPYTFPLIRPLFVLLDEQLITPVKSPLSEMIPYPCISSQHLKHISLMCQIKSKKD